LLAFYKSRGEGWWRHASGPQFGVVLGRQLDNLAVWYKADVADLPTLVDLFDEDVKAFVLARVLSD